MEVRFVIVAPAKSRKSYTVRLPLVVGRGDEAKFRIQQDSVSRRHCEFTVKDGVVHVADLGSTNGTHVGGKRIEAHAATAVSSGAEVRIGAAILRVEYAAATASAPRDDDTVPLSALAAVASESVAELPELEPVAEALPDLEPVAEAPVEPEAVEPPAPAETAAAAPPGAPLIPEAIATPPQAGAPAFPEPAPEAGPADFAALAATAPAPPPPAEGSFDFLGDDDAAPPAADDKLDDFFKSIS